MSLIENVLSLKGISVILQFAITFYQEVDRVVLTELTYISYFFFSTISFSPVFLLKRIAGFSSSIIILIVSMRTQVTVTI